MRNGFWLIVAMVALGGCDDGAGDDADAAAGDPMDMASDGGSDDVGGPGMEVDAGPHPGLLDPTQAQAQAPEMFAVRVETTTGEFTIDVVRAWSPLGADRFFNLVTVGYYDDCAFFRVLPGFVAQTGLNGDPVVQATWLGAGRLADDPVVESNTAGRVTYATAGPNTRTTQIFFNYGDNSGLDGQGFSPFGEVDDLTALEALYSGYGEGPPQGNGPDQGRIQSEGNAYLRAEYPELDYIITARVMP